MKKDVQHISMREVQSVQGEKCPKVNEFPTFNICDHHLIDLSDIEGGTDNWQNTLSIKLPHGKFVTFCVMDLGDSINIDTKLHGMSETKVLAFKEGSTESIHNMNLYAIIGAVKR
jgi:hypothetical protein